MSNVKGPDDAQNPNFEELVAQYQGSVLRMCFLYLCDKTLAEDAVQETFLQVKRRAYTYQPGTDARAWILQIAKNKCLDELRRRKTRAQHEAPMREEGVQQSFPLLEEITKCLTILSRTTTMPSRSICDFAR